MFKKLLSLVLAVVMVAALVACSDMDSKEAKMTESPLPEVELKKDFDVPADFKIGFILLHDEASTYDLNFINAVKKVQETLGLTDDQIIYKKGIPESNVCYETACDLADAGCKIIFADSFGHESHLLEAAKKYPALLTEITAHLQEGTPLSEAFVSIFG